MTKVLASTDMHRTRKALRWKVLLEWKVQDCWIGVFWTSTTGPDSRWAVLDVWVCLLPCLPVHLFFNRPAPPLSSRSAGRSG